MKEVPIEVRTRIGNDPTITAVEIFGTVKDSGRNG